MYCVYIFRHRNSLDGFPSIQQLVPLDLLLLCLVRCVILLVFVHQHEMNVLVKYRAPLLTTFGSLLYLLVRAKFASTIEAFFTLGFQFTFSWAQLIVYFHAMLTHGELYWKNQFVSPLTLDEENVEPEFEFPESSSYVKPNPVAVQGNCV